PQLAQHAAIAATRTLVLRDAVVAFVLESLGSTVVTVREAALSTLLNIADVVFPKAAATGSLSSDEEQWSESFAGDTSAVGVAGGDGGSQLFPGRPPKVEDEDHEDPSNKRASELLHRTLLGIEHTYFPTAIVDANLSTALRLAFRAFGRLTRKQIRNSQEALRVAPKLFALLNANPDASEEILEALNGVLLWFAESTSIKTRAKAEDPPEPVGRGAEHQLEGAAPASSAARSGHDRMG
ncbi:unnamed protein product, partial [Amoebophrya sp. A120]